MQVLPAQICRMVQLGSGTAGHGAAQLLPSSPHLSVNNPANFLSHIIESES